MTEGYARVSSAEGLVSNPGPAKSFATLQMVHQAPPLQHLYKFSCLVARWARKLVTRYDVVWRI